MELTRRRFLAGAAGTGLSLGLPGFFSAAAEAARSPFPIRQLPAHFVYEYGTGQVLSAENEHKPVNPASLTKLLIASAFYDMKKDGLLTAPERQVRARQRDVERLLIVSDNKAAARVAEFLTLQEPVLEQARQRNDVKAGTQWAFTRLIGEPMIDNLEMQDTAFWNASGLPGYDTETPPNVTTAASLSRLCDHILKHHPEIHEICSQPYLDSEEKRGRNTNPLLEAAEHRSAAPYEGVDGLKTGYIDDAGFNLVATAQRNGRRIVVVSIGNATRQARIDNVTALLDQGFTKLERLYRPRPRIKEPWEEPFFDPSAYA